MCEIGQAVILAGLVRDWWEVHFVCCCMYVNLLALKGINTKDQATRCGMPILNVYYVVLWWMDHQVIREIKVTLSG